MCRRRARVRGGSLGSLRSRRSLIRRTDRDCAFRGQLECREGHHRGVGTKPQTIGLPEVIDLKHANAEDLAEQFNACCCRRMARWGDASSSELALSSNSTSVRARSRRRRPRPRMDSMESTDPRPTTTSPSGGSARRVRRRIRGLRLLVGKIRIVPVWRQNAVMVI